MRRSPIALAAIALALLGAACGSTDDDASSNDAEPSRTIEIEMQDNEYLPETVSVEADETVRFVFTNTGEATHDAYVGDEAAQEEHEEEMNGHDGHGGDDSEAITVEPGETGELTRTFAADEEVLIGCHEPGHYEAGMRLSVDVT